jgi:DNA (cytosine-5)-methyltransferase 1
MDFALSHLTMPRVLVSSGRTRSKQASLIKKSYKVASLFSGCGGLDLGFKGGFDFLEHKYEKNPFEIVWANEIVTIACETYKRNVGEHIVCDNIWNVINSIPNDIDVIIGGFPCQDLSINGKGAGINGERSSLYTAMVKAISLRKPAAFVAENVKGLLMKHNRSSYDKIFEDFSSLGYNLSVNLYNAADYSVPQNRERVFIVGIKEGLGHFISPSPQLFCKHPHITSKKALSDLEKVEEDSTINHIWSRAIPSKDQGSRKLNPHRPGQTIRAECHGNIQFHYSLPRRISMREAARLQSFPDNFIFEGGIRQLERQIGNAVPPVLAWNIARALSNSLKSVAHDI